MKQVLLPKSCSAYWLSFGFAVVALVIFAISAQAQGIPESVTAITPPEPSFWTFKNIAYTIGAIIFIPFILDRLGISLWIAAKVFVGLVVIGTACNYIIANAHGIRVGLSNIQNQVGDEAHSFKKWATEKSSTDETTTRVEETLVNDVGEIPTKSTSSENQKQENLDFDAKSEEERPYEVSVLTCDNVNRRIHELMQDDYAELKDMTWYVDADYVSIGRVFSASGFDTDGGRMKTQIMLDEKQNSITVGVYRAGKVQLYAENDAKVPSEMQEWANENTASAEESHPEEEVAPQEVSGQHYVRADEAGGDRVFMCAYCGTVVRKANGAGSPNGARCSAKDTSHQWQEIGLAGDNTYSCRYCRVTVNLVQSPRSNFRCPSGDGAAHRFEQL